MISILTKCFNCPFYLEPCLANIQQFVKGNYEVRIMDDFSLTYLEQFLDEKIDREEFQKWVAQFKDLYRNLGAIVD